jgi:nicotinamide mononucleotide adenylyltransferase
MANKESEKLIPVNIIIGRFQPFTTGHLSMSQELKKVNRLPCVYVYVRSKSGKNSHFNDSLTTNIMTDVVKYEKDVLGTFPMENAFIPSIIKEAQNRGFNPVLIGAGEDRASSYQSMVDRMKNVEVLPGFGVYELKGRVTSATEVRKAILGDDKTKFEKFTPKYVHKYFNELKKELELNLLKTESILELVESYNLDLKVAEQILLEFKPFLMNQNMNDYQIENYIENILRVKYSMYTNFFKGNPGLAMITK